MTRLVKIFFLISGCLVLSLSIKAQNDSAQTIVLTEANAQYGFIWKHRPALAYITRTHVSALNVTLGFPSVGKRAWEQIYGYPLTGIGYYYANLGSTILGEVHGIYTYLNIPIINKPRFRFNYQIAPGISYLTKTFDSDKNYYNNAIGTHFNVYFNLSLDIKFRLTPHIILKTGFGITHFSNGAFSLPNTGINVISANTGICYLFGDPDYKPIPFELPEFEKKNEFSVFVGVGLREIPPEDGPKYFVSTLNLEAGRIISRKRKLGIGLDIIYDKSLYTRLEREGYDHIQQVYLLRSGIHISHELLIDKFCISIQAGSYLYSEWKEDGVIYSRFALKYHLTKHLVPQIALFTHYAKAHFVELGMGWRW